MVAQIAQKFVRKTWRDFTYIFKYLYYTTYKRRTLKLGKCGTIIHYIGNLDSRVAGYGRGKVCAGSAVIELGAADYVEVFATVNTVSGGAARVNGETTQTWFNGFKLVGF